MSYHCGQRRAWCGVQTPEGRRLLRQRLLHRRRRRHRGLLGLTSAYLCAARPTRALLHPHCTTSLHPSRHPLGRWVHWADGLARRVVRGSDRLQPLRLPSSSWPHFKYVQPALRLPSVLAARHIRLHELNMSAKFARSLGSISSGGRPPRTPRVVMMAQLCGGLRAKNENVASDNSP